MCIAKWARFALSSACVGLLMLGTAPPVLATFTFTENFDSAPAAWVGVNNTATPSQNFGWRDSNLAGGVGAGEVGGTLSFAEPGEAASYSTSIGSIDPKVTSLNMSGRGRFTPPGFNSGFSFLGWYNSATALTHPVPANGIGFLTDTDGGEVADGVRLAWRAGGVTGYADAWITMTLGTTNSWSFRLDYNPAANGGNGTITGTITGDTGTSSQVLNLPAGQKNWFTNFDRFGMVSTENIPDYYRERDVYWDDLRYTSALPGFPDDPPQPPPPTPVIRPPYVVTENFNSPPAGWVGVNNTTLPQNFGWRSSNNAGGVGTGEVGGFFSLQTDDKPAGHYASAAAHYATDIGLINPQVTSLTMSGNGRFTNGGTGSGFSTLGWYNSTAAMTYPLPGDFIGLFTSGDDVKLAYRAGDAAGANEFIATDLGDISSWSFTLDYNPAANGGNGAITGTITGSTGTSSLVLDLPAGHKNWFTNFDRFGLVATEHPSGSSYTKNVFYDDLSYTTSTPPLLIGDYNGDEVVDAADYVVWRDNVNTNNPLLNRDPMAIGMIGQQDYRAWRSHLGNSSMGSSAVLSAIGVPEPTTCSLLLIACVAMNMARRRA